MKLRVVSLFAGVGGFDLAFERAGAETVAVCEIDAGCREVLARRFPGAKQFTDVRALRGEELPEFDLLTFGFPCQDLSTAGQRKGLKGKRSGLFYEVVRIIKKTQPRWLLWENVAGLLHCGAGGDMRAVLGELCKLGYSGAWAVLDAKHFGVPQQRRRVFGCFALGDTGVESAARVLAVPCGRWGYFEEERQTRPCAAAGAARGAGGAGSAPAGGGGELIGFHVCTDHANRHESAGPLLKSHAAAVCFSARIGSLHPPMAVAFQPAGGFKRAGGAELCPTLQKENPHAVAVLGPAPRKWTVRLLTPVECERCQGFPDNWTAGHSDTARRAMMGNAVCVPVVEWIARRLVKEAQGGRAT
jgi:DNA (cytosine-5)-methyltransferase 1